MELQKRCLRTCNCGARAGMEIRRIGALHEKRSPGVNLTLEVFGGKPNGLLLSAAYQAQREFFTNSFGSS